VGTLWAEEFDNSEPKTDRIGGEVDNSASKTSDFNNKVDNSTAKTSDFSDKADNSADKIDNVWENIEKAPDIFNQAAKKYKFQTEKANLLKTPDINLTPPRLPKELFIIIGSVAVLFLIFFLVRSYLKSRKISEPIKDKEEAEPQEELSTQALQETGLKADRLAKEGQIIEAMHSLLLETIEELKRQKNLVFPSSFTSREIVYDLNLGGPATQALGDIVTTVEPTWFGQMNPTLEQYQSLRARFDAFLHILAPVPQPAYLNMRQRNRRGHNS
jgi:hypothetical protein